jgi:hypothetical protein
VARASRSSAVAVGAIRCDYSEHEGIPDADARTATRLICAELDKANAPTTIYRVRWERLDKTIFVSVEPDGARGAMPGVALQSLSEVLTAAPRLARAALENRSMADTAEADNLTASETTLNPLRAVRTGIDLGLVGVTGVGRASDLSSGVSVAVTNRWKEVAIVLGARTGGLTDGNHVGFVSADVGLRYPLSEAKTAVFLGGGASLAIHTWGAPPNRMKGEGLAGFLEVGVDAFRDRRVGVWAALRCDVPTFALEDGRTQRATVVPLALSMGVAWH